MSYNCLVRRTLDSSILKLRVHIPYISVIECHEEGFRESTQNRKVKKYERRQLVYLHERLPQSLMDNSTLVQEHEAIGNAIHRLERQVEMLKESLRAQAIPDQGVAKKIQDSERKLTTLHSMIKERQNERNLATRSEHNQPIRVVAAQSRTVQQRYKTGVNTTRKRTDVLALSKNTTFSSGQCWTDPVSER